MERINDRIMRNLMKRNPIGVLLIQAENLSQVPGNRLPLTIRVGRKIDMIRFGCTCLQILYDIFLIFGNDIRRLEVIFNVNAQSVLALDRKITDMSLGRYDIKAAPKILLNCLAFGW